MNRNDYINSLIWDNYATKLSCNICQKIYNVKRQTLLKITREYCKRNGSIEGFQYRCNKCNPSGKECGKWKGGKVKRRQYIGIHRENVPEEYKSMCIDGGCYVLEHRLVVAMREKRCLLPTEHVHHIDLNPKNNSSDNLLLVNSWTHCLITKLEKIIKEKDIEIKKLKEIVGLGTCSTV